MTHVLGLIKNIRILYFDSYTQYTQDTLNIDLRQRFDQWLTLFIQMEFAHRLETEVTELTSPSKEVQSVIVSNAPQQSNGFDCGVFTCFNMYRMLLVGIDTCMQYEVETLGDFRADMCRLMNGEPTQHPGHNRGPEV